jgi:hypothetical protein
MLRLCLPGATFGADGGQNSTPSYNQIAVSSQAVTLEPGDLASLYWSDSRRWLWIPAAEIRRKSGWCRAISADTGAKCIGLKESGAAMRNRPRRLPVAVSFARSISAQTLTA